MEDRHPSGFPEHQRHPRSHGELVEQFLWAIYIQNDLILDLLVAIHNDPGPDNTAQLKALREKLATKRAELQQTIDATSKAP